MRILTIITVILIGLGCAGTKKAGNNSSSLNGTWVPVRQEMGGKELPEAVYKTQQLIIDDSSYTLVAESVDKGVVRYSGQQMDIYGREGVNKGKHFTALYKLDNGQLTICYNLRGTDYPTTFETAGKPLYFLSVFKKTSIVQ
jgi:uncharacterized protein (TIGR03067 family)